MSFCRILSTLCSQVVFHNIPHFGKRAGQKVQRKNAVAVQNVKPLYFLSHSFEKNLLSYSICFNNQIDQGMRRRVSKGRDQRWRDRRWRDYYRGRVLREFSLFKPNLINMNVHSATCSCSVELHKLWYTLADFLHKLEFSRGFLYILN